MNIAFFGTPERAVTVLDTLKRRGLSPTLIITQPDRPQGRKMLITPPPVKVWAQQEHIPVLQPENLNDETFKSTLKNGNFDVFVVVAYGNILKKEILDIPTYGAINLHASLLPRLRGSCPIETALLTDERNTGVSIILMDELMDHGPILASKAVTVPEWPLSASALAQILLCEGAELMAETLPRFVAGEIIPQEQDHASATYTKKIVKEDGLIHLDDDPYKNFLKFNAYKDWPKTYFFQEKEGVKTRIIVTEALYEDGRFVIKKVIPEGKKEMTW